MAIENPFYTPEVHGPYELYSLGDFPLDEGGVLPDLQLAYTTVGTLNEARDNAILIPTWYSGTHEVMQRVYVGPERALDPNRYFIIIVN
ncbi:MAG: hypothetical protein JHD05_01745, partial [Thermoleophilia bacterium]|nr:hypothetical protein [Thermoleophilia bacterium]